MVPIVGYSTVAGIPLADIVNMGWMSQSDLDAIVERTKYGRVKSFPLLKLGPLITRQLHLLSTWRNHI